MEYMLLVFQSTHAAMAAQKHLGNRFPIQVMPTLRQLSKSCGISIRFEPELLELIREEMHALALDPGLYQFYRVAHTPSGTDAAPLA